MEKAIEAGTKPERIGFVSFTKKATTEARERACLKFNIHEKALPFFRTLHSLAFWTLGLSGDRVMSKQNYTDLSKKLGLRVTGDFDMSSGAAEGYSKGDRMLFLENLARIRCCPLVDQWRETPENLSWHELERTQSAFLQYKHANALLDFTDMLSMFVERDTAPPLDLLLVDEAQDLSRLQWKMVDLLSREAGRVIVAADDDQAIFRWAGADIEHFIGLKGEVTVLGQSYRVPRAVQEFAFNVLQYIRPDNRRPKEWTARSEEGLVAHHSSIDHVDFSDGGFLVLARNTYLLSFAEDKLRRDGFVYEKWGKSSIRKDHLDAIRAWEKLRRKETIDGTELGSVFRHISAFKNRAREVQESEEISHDEAVRRFNLPTTRIWHEVLDAIPLQDRTYIVAALRRKEKITQAPRIRLSTIHGAKGGEADKVVLFLDVADRSYQYMRDGGMEDEARVFYVGATRARQELHIVRPKTRKFFPIPR